MKRPHEAPDCRCSVCMAFAARMSERYMQIMSRAFGLERVAGEKIQAFIVRLEASEAWKGSQ